jgi:hypothetical protein
MELASGAKRGTYHQAKVIDVNDMEDVAYFAIALIPSSMLHLGRITVVDGAKNARKENECRPYT